jgi:hypothetical protein
VKSIGLLVDGLLKILYKKISSPTNLFIPHFFQQPFHNYKTNKTTNTSQDQTKN